MQMRMILIHKQIHWKIFQEKFLVLILGNLQLFSSGLVECISTVLTSQIIQHGYLTRLALSQVHKLFGQLLVKKF